MSWRRLRVLIEHLPPESATMTELRNAMTEEQLAEQAAAGEPERARWSQLEQLTAAVIDRLAIVEFVLRCAYSDSKGPRPTPPEPVRRPGAKAPAPKSRMTPEGAEVLFRLINGDATSD